MGKKKYKKSLGDIVKVPFDAPFHTYARVLTDASYAFYDCKTQIDMEPSVILNKPILFIIAVSEYAVSEGKWPIIGNVPLEDNLKKNPPRFREAILPVGSPKAYEIFENGEIRFATKEECKGLEYDFVWSPEKVEERLRDYYAGRLNFQAEYYRIKE